MRRNLINQFFRTLDREFGKPAQILLTGAAAGALLGHLRPSQDIDFEIRLGRRGEKEKKDFAEAVQKASQKTGLAFNYSEDIGHWSMINYLDYRKKALPYKKIGRIEIKLMAPAYWTIGKMSRYNEMDAEDMLKVIRKRKLKAETLATLWGKALASSLLSLELGRFRDNVLHFFRQHGKSLWGKGFDPDKAIALFKRRAKVK